MSSPVLEYAPSVGVRADVASVLRDCLQCGTCSAVCPLEPYMDHAPRRLVGLLRAGQDDAVLRSRAIWVCTSCYACTVECPRQIPVTDAIYALKREAMRTRAYPRRFPTPVMARQFVRTVDHWGRSTESWISLALYLRTDPLQLLRHARLAVRLWRAGRLSFRRESVREPAQLRRMLDALDDRRAAA
jgi:heterodisulfide reductase subunit C